MSDSFSSASMADAALCRRMLDHCVDAVTGAALETVPFPHFVATDFFPGDAYLQLVASLPALEYYEPFSYEKHHDKNNRPNRFRFSFTAESLQKLPEEQRVVWATVAEVFRSSELKEAVYRKLAPGLMFRYGISQAQVAELPGFALPELFRETEGYSIKPHPDTRKKVVTLQLAITKSEAQRELGTEFYRRSMNPRAWLKPPRGFVIVKRMPFQPNTAFAFSVLNTLSLKSWHGRTPIPGNCGPRNSLLNIWYEKPAHVMSRPDGQTAHPETAHRKAA